LHLADNPLFRRLSPRIQPRVRFHKSLQRCCLRRWIWGSHGAEEAIEMTLFLLALIQWWNTYKPNPLLQSRFIARRGKWGSWDDQNNDRKKWMAENPSFFTHYRLPCGTKYCRPMTTKPDSLLHPKT
jgi:hypothetical protein